MRSNRPDAATLLAQLEDAQVLRGAALFADLAELPAHESALRSLVEALRAGAYSARQFADAAWRLLDGSGPAPGRYATPWPLGRFLAQQLPAPERAVVLDPACGAGHLLVAQAERMRPDPERWHGWETSQAHVHATRIALWLAGERRGKPADYRHVRPLDALLEAPCVRADLLLANPPFVSIRALYRSHGSDYAERLRHRFPHLRGSFDLYLPFLLALPDWLAETGRFALVIPATLWSAVYAAPARELLAPWLTTVVSFTPRLRFGRAQVATQVLVGELPAARSPRQSLSARFPQRGERLQLEDAPTTPFTAATVPLAEVARLEAGTPGYLAHRTAERLVEREAAEPAIPFVVSRSIDPYQLHIDRPVRFLGRRWQHPLLPLAALTAGKRRLFLCPKVLVAGVSRRLEAARDALGVGLGVGVYAVVSDHLPAELLLALLNSRIISDWYRRQYQGRELSGGYFAVNCAQLGAIPVPTAWLTNGGSAGEIIALVQRRERLEGAECTAIDESLDELVAQALHPG